MRPSFVLRARFSSSTASPTIRWNASSTFFNSSGDSDRMSTSMNISVGMELTEVPPPTTPTLNVVRGDAGTCSRESFVMALPMANAGLTRPNAP
jgi:hypothetical protein